MDDRTTPTPPAATPDPHAGTPLPDAPAGARTAEGEAVVRPEQEEDLGPLAGLVGAASAEASSEASAVTPGDRDPADEALLEQMGVEEEGIEGGQILGLVIATVVAVLALAVVLIYLFYIPRLTQVQTGASDVALYPELEQIRVEGLARLNQFAGTDSTGFSMPIERAMALTSRDYSTAPSPGAPQSRAEFNTLAINQGMGRTVGADSASPERSEQARLRAVQGSSALAPPARSPGPALQPPDAAPGDTLAR